MAYTVNRKQFHVEILTPKQKSQKLEADLERFAEKYREVFEAGHMICITDNPLGHLSFQGTEVIEELGLPTNAEQVSIHLNTFHTKKDLDALLATTIDLGINNLLIITGPFGIPVVVECWMSKKLHLLSECVGYEIPEDTPYDPMANLRALMANYPHCEYYLALTGFKSQWPYLDRVWEPEDSTS